MMRFNFDVWPKVGLPMFSILLLSTFASAQQKSMPPRTQDRPLESRIETMERAQRDEWQKPDEVVRALDLKPGEVVADVGAGSGYFTRRLAIVVAPVGKVYAVDVAPDVLGYLKERADREGLHNIVTIVSQPTDPMLPVNSVDLVFFFAILRTTSITALSFIASWPQPSKPMAAWPSSTILPTVHTRRTSLSNWCRVPKSSAKSNRPVSNS